MLNITYIFYNVDSELEIVENYVINSLKLKFTISLHEFTNNYLL